MKRSLFQPRPSHGFTLVELLMAMAVLVLMMVLVTTLVNNTSRLTTASQEVISADAGGREALDRISFDLGRMVLREDLPPLLDRQPGNDAFTFYAQAPGYEGDRGISRIGFRVKDGILERGAEGAFWSKGASDKPVVDFHPSSPDPIADGDFAPLAASVFRIEFTFLMQDGEFRHNPSALFGDTPATRVRAVVIAVATLPTRLRQQMSGDAAGLAALLPDAVDGQDLLSLWKPVTLSPTFLEPSENDPYPKAVRAGVRVYQRTVYLDY